MMDTEYSVIVRDVCKKYSTAVPVINGLNMSIPTGYMYGLLGSSGCGKTTLLKCILGKLRIDSGSIQLSVKNWKDVGFMPQTVSLHTELEINELFIFYGTLFGMFGEKHKARVNELVDLLELPPLTRLIGDCSGGQQRRISLAVTLLHNPDLLLLDEPTVGLDPLLSHRIWAYLKNLCLAQKKTIIVTTHYMEEARSLHLIGLMRGGVLLAEKPPSTLLNDYNCSSLDDVFLVLSQKQQSLSQENKSISGRKNSSALVKIESRLHNEETFNMDHVKAQIYKNYKWTLRNVPVTLFILLLPLFSAVLTGILFKEIKTDLKVGYYSEELYNNSCQINKTIYAKGCSPSPPYSCDYIEIIQQQHPTIRFDSVEEGLEAIKTGQTFVFIHFPYNFTNTILRRMNFTSPKKNEMFKEDTVSVWFDNTVYTVVFYAKIDIYTSLQKILAKKCMECGINTELAKSPLQYQKLIYGENSTLRSNIYPHFMNAFLFYTTFIYTSASLIMEKDSGVLERVQMNGMTTMELLTANFIVQFIVLNVQNALALIAVHVIFMEGYLGSMALMYCILLLNEFFGIIVGLLVLTFSVTPTLINYFGVGIILTIILTNGMIWPSQGIHWILRYFVKLIPVNMVSASYTHVMLHGYNIMHSLVYPGVIYVIVWILALALITFIRVRINNNQL